MDGRNSNWAMKKTAILPLCRYVARRRVSWRIRPPEGHIWPWQAMGLPTDFKPNEAKSRLKLRSTPSIALGLPRLSVTFLRQFCTEPNLVVLLNGWSGWRPLLLWRSFKPSAPRIRRSQVQRSMRPTPKRFVSCVERVAAQSGRGAAHEYVGISMLQKRRFHHCWTCIQRPSSRNQRQPPTAVPVWCRRHLGTSSTPQKTNMEPENDGFQ